MKIADKSVVQMHYTLTNDAGEVIDSSEGRESLAFLQGAGNIIPGLEQAMLGKKAGDEFTETIAPEMAYGEYHAELKQEVPKEAFEGIEDLQVGMMLQADTPNGPVPIRITAVEGDTVSVDGNHELAGETLHFAVNIVEVRVASEEELAHGHVHGEGGHHH